MLRVFSVRLILVEITKSETRWDNKVSSLLSQNEVQCWSFLSSIQIALPTNFSTTLKIPPPPPPLNIWTQSFGLSSSTLFNLMTSLHNDHKYSQQEGDISPIFHQANNPNNGLTRIPDQWHNIWQVASFMSVEESALILSQWGCYDGQIYALRGYSFQFTYWFSWCVWQKVHWHLT